MATLSSITRGRRWHAGRCAAPVLVIDLKPSPGLAMAAPD
jgi:hypothetical protein